MPGATGKHGVPDKPAVPADLQADTPSRMAGQVVYLYKAAPKANNLAMVQLKVCLQGQQVRVGGVHADRGTGGLPQLN
jgi:hypothetical protein